MADQQEEDGCAAHAAPLGGIRTVAVIGAGLSGLVSAAHLLRAKLDVTVFERADDVGGAWRYSARPDRDPPFPSLQPPTLDRAAAELERMRGEAGGGGLLSAEEAAARFAPPGPVFASMTGRTSKCTMQTSLMPWREGSVEPLGHGEIFQYLKSIALDGEQSVQDKIRFRTRVEAVLKGEGASQWSIQTSTLHAGVTGDYTVEEATWKFDAVVVATGRYGVPRVPDVPGLATWKNMFPDRVIHSKQYRTPTRFRGKKVLIIGAFISALEIAKELGENGATVYQSALDTKVDFRDDAGKVAMAASFVLDSDRDGSGTPQPGRRQPPPPPLLDDDSPIPGRVVLQDGQVLEGIHHVIIATGYLTTYPFLGPVLEQPGTRREDADDKVVVTADGRTVHNLHEDIFYIPDPTLAFIGVTHFASTFSMYDFQAQVLAAVLAGRVRLPPEQSMKAEQARRKKGVVEGTLLNSIFMMDDFVILRLLEWANADLEAGGFEPLSGPDDEWWEAWKQKREGAEPLLGKLQENYIPIPERERLERVRHGGHFQPPRGVNGTASSEL